MSWNPKRLTVLLCLLTFSVVGCSPSQPMYLRDTGDLSYYLEKATDIEYPDIDTADLEEVTQARPPITVIDPDFDAFMDLTLEQCVSMGLKNAKILRGYGTPNLQQNRVSPGIDNLANGPAAAGTIYNVAIRESEPGFIGTPGQISAPGAILTNTGLDVNQGVESALADFDAQFTTSAFWSRSDEPRNVDPGIINNPAINPFDRLVFQQDSVQWQSEIAKKSANGTQMFFRNVNVYTSNNTPLVTDGGFQNLDSWYRTALEMEVRQPLLRGRGAFIQRMPIIISRIGTDQELANLEAQLQNMVTNIEIRYWDLYCAYRNLEASKTGRDAALETWRILNDQFEGGVDVNKQQVAQSSEQYHFFDAQVIEAFNNLLLAEGALRWLIGISPTDGYVIRPIDEANMAPIEFDFHQAKCEALTFRPELRQQLWEVKKKCLAVGYSKNSLLPEFNFTALYRFLGLGNFYATSEDNSLDFADPSSGAWNGLFGGGFQEFQMGLDFRMPIGFRRESANVRNSQLKLARELARTEDMKLDITREVTEALRAVAANRRLMHSAFNRWKDTSIEEEHFKELEQAGLETLDVALDAQRRRSQAEIAFYNALCEYNKCLALMHRRKGTILAYSNISMAEGPWPGKAYQDAIENARRRAAGRPINYGWTRPQVVSQGPQWPTSGEGTVGGTRPVDTTVINGPTVNDPMMNGYYDQGTPVVDPNYLPLDGALPVESIQGMPIPGNTAPLQTNPTPATQGSSTRNGGPRPNTQRSRIRQVSHNEPISQTNATPNNLSQRRRQHVALRTNQNPAPARMIRMTADSSAKRLQRTAAPMSRPSQQQIGRSNPGAKGLGATGTRSNVPVQRSQRTKMDWERFGLTRPTRVPNMTRATIKTSGGEEKR